MAAKKSDNNDVKFSEVEENSTLMANGRSKPSDRQTFATFIYNKREGTFLGRNGKSWFQIVFFYIVFYTLLAAFWGACLYIFLQTIDDEIPRYHGANTIIGANPGVGYQPWLEGDPDSTLIKFDKNDPSTYELYVNAMNKHLAKYQNINGTRVCHGGEGNTKIINDEGKVQDKENSQACRFELDIFDENECGPKSDFGFKDGKPCVILSLNRLIGWKPEDYPDGDFPPEVKARYKKGSIAFNCDGGSDSDKELLGRVVYVPAYGIDGKFYPFAVMKNYHQPIAMVKFTSLPPNRVVMVECRAYAKNIEHDVESRVGMVNFELLLQNKAATPATPATGGS